MSPITSTFVTICSYSSTLTVTALLIATSAPKSSTEVTCATSSAWVCALEAPKSNTPSLADVFLWVCQHPGSDAEAVSEHFGIGYIEAHGMVKTLLAQGLLDFA